ncbi:MAG: D-alanine--D-alanine ligase [Candidatus Omnitrophica bacterium]|nr:D-alanine--D-alanine ligase [Candidatus Omnitrophota bacterium]
MKTKRRVGVLMGGPSRERDISIKSGKAVSQALKNKGIDVVPVELMECSAMNGYREFVKQQILSCNIDIAFIALHGEFGEDGMIQRLLEEVNIPYTGSRIDASKLGMDKISSKDIFKLNNISIPRYTVIHNKDKLNAQQYFTILGCPLVVKPSSEGSSIGLSIVESENDFYIAIDIAFKYSDSVIIEEYIQGREITVGILEDKPLPIVEIIPKRKFFDFKAKYEKGLTEYKVPASIDKTQYDACQRMALEAHKALGAHFFSRVDMILSNNGIPVVLEVNTIPGLTEMSLLPKAALAAGVDFEGLILKILKSVE